MNIWYQYSEGGKVCSQEHPEIGCVPPGYDVIAIGFRNYDVDPYLSTSSSAVKDEHLRLTAERSSLSVNYINGERKTSTKAVVRNSISRAVDGKFPGVIYYFLVEAGTGTLQSLSLNIYRKPASSKIFDRLPTFFTQGGYINFHNNYSSSGDMATYNISMNGIPSINSIGQTYYPHVNLLEIVHLQDDHTAFENGSYDLSTNKINDNNAIRSVDFLDNTKENIYAILSENMPLQICIRSYDANLRPREPQGRLEFLNNNSTYYHTIFISVGKDTAYTKVALLYGQRVNVVSVKPGLYRVNIM